MHATRLAPIAAILLAGCGGPELPSTFEEVAATQTRFGTVGVVRDAGTGCEWLMAEKGSLEPRMERSVDGATVKQRCVITGEERPSGALPPVSAASTAGLAPAAAPARGTTFTPVGPDAQEQAVRQAIRDAAGDGGAAVPPPTIPPPQPQPAEGDDEGVESQLKR